MTDIQKENKSGGKVPNRGSVNFPRLRFPEFEGEYRQYSFEDLFLFSTGKNIKQNEASPEYETPCVRYGELYHLYNEIISEVVNKTNLDKSDLTFSIGNEILLPSAGEDPLDIGSASALTIKGVAIGRTINILRPLKKNLYSNIYVSYYINEKLKKKISTLAKGVSISNVYNSDLKILNALLPSISEQQKISSFLLLINSRIQTQNKILEQLETLIKNVSEKIFSQNIKFKKFEKKWEVKTLGEILIEINERTINSNQYRVLSSTAKGLFYQSDYFKKEVASKDNAGYKILKINQLVFSPQNLWLGNINVNTTYEIGIVSPSYKVFSFNEKAIVSYCKYFLKSSKMMFEYEQCSEQGASIVRRNLNMDLFLNIPILLPKLEEQIQISSFLTKIDQKIQTEKAILEQLEIQKKYLLQQMFV